LLSIWGTGFACLAAVSACQAVAKLETRNNDPLPGQCIALSAGTGPKMRVVNLVPSATNTDFCIRSSGAAWGRPLLRDSGNNDICSAGLAYEGETIPFGGPAATIDVKAVPAGQTCAAAATSEIDGVAMPADGSVMTFMRMGGGAVPEKIVALPEDSNSDPVNQRLRVVNALAGSAGITFGLANDPVLPTTIALVAFTQPVPFGGVEPAGPAGPGSVDAHGYFSVVAESTPLGIANPNDSHALIAFSLPSGNETETIYVVGSTSDPNYPVRGLICDEFNASPNDALLASCVETELPTIITQTFNVSLYGGAAPYENDRRQRVYDAVAKSDADAMCIVEAGDETQDKKPILDAVAAAHSQLQFHYYPTLDLNTQPTDPTDWQGNTPPAPTTPPCGGSVDPTLVSDTWNCMMQNCDTTPGQAGGQLDYASPSTGTKVVTQSQCLTDKCAKYLAQLRDVGDPNKIGCLNCMIVNAVSRQTYADSQTACDTDTRRPFAFKGQTPSMILSRFPFAKKADGSDDVDTFVLPSTSFRRTVLRAKLQLGGGSTVDFYCAQLTSAFVSGDGLPYTGPYSNGGSNGFADEQQLQANKAIAWIKAQSGSGPAIITGDWHASKQENAYQGSVDKISDGVITSLEDPSTGFKLVHTQNWKQTCNYCPAPADPWDSLNAPGYDLVDTFVLNMKPTATQETMLYVPDYSNPATYVSFPDGTQGPISEYFSRSIHILRP
jgi:hypothetical protein